MNDDLKDIHERVTAGRLLSISAANISSGLDSFCNWLLLGVGAAYSLVFANMDSLQNLVSPQSLKISLLFLLVAISLGIVQHWLASIVAASSAVAEKAGQIGQELSEREIDIDFKVVFREMEKGLFYPAKWIARRSFEKAISGDFAASGRLSAALSQVQSWLALAIMALIIAAIAQTICGVSV